jgi:hypothetical protein
MTTLDFNKALRNAKGEEIPQKLNEILSDFLQSETAGNGRKLWIWSVLLVTNAGVLILDPVDKKALGDAIESTNRMPAMVKGQLLEILDAA